jgi:hypothetical protein
LNVQKDKISVRINLLILNLRRPCNLTPFSPCPIGLVDYLFASRHKKPGLKSPRGYLCRTGILVIAMSRYKSLVRLGKYCKRTCDLTERICILLCPSHLHHLQGALFRVLSAGSCLSCVWHQSGVLSSASSTGYLRRLLALLHSMVSVNTHCSLLFPPSLLNFSSCLPFPSFPSHFPSHLLAYRLPS